MAPKPKRRLTELLREESTELKLDYAICLLALISQRPVDNEEIPELLRGVSSENVGVTQTSDFLPDEHEAATDAANELRGLEIVDTGKSEHLQHADMLSKVLDRLAETLARFKSPRGTKCTLDAKNVCATMMSVHHKDSPVRIFCSKNEGLDEEDVQFLARWEECMQFVAKKGKSLRCHATTAFLIFHR